MPLHERRLIRDAIVAQLKGTAPAFRTSAGARVVKSREAPPKMAQLPFISVYNELEPIKEGSDKGTEIEREFEATIVAWLAASSDSDVDDALDALALEIEAAMDIDRQLDGYVSRSRLKATQFGIDLTGERPLGAVSLTYTCTYFTETRNSAPTDIFDEVSAKTKLGPTQADDDQTSTLITGINAG